jgi:hypothetical protein
MPAERVKRWFGGGGGTRRDWVRRARGSRRRQREEKKRRGDGGRDEMKGERDGREAREAREAREQAALGTKGKGVQKRRGHGVRITAARPNAGTPRGWGAFAGEATISFSCCVPAAGPIRAGQRQPRGAVGGKEPGAGGRVRRGKCRSEMMI